MWRDTVKQTSHGKYRATPVDLDATPLSSPVCLHREYNFSKLMTLSLGRMLSTISKLRNIMILYAKRTHLFACFSLNNKDSRRGSERDERSAKLPHRSPKNE